MLFCKVGAVAPLKLRLVPPTAARPSGSQNSQYAKCPTLGLGASAAGAPRSHPRPIRAVTWSPRHGCGPLAPVRRCALHDGKVLDGRHRLRACNDLDLMPRTTNPIENLNGSVAHYTRNVKRWQDGQMTLRWVASALSDASGRFRKLRGYHDMKTLMAALDARVAQTKSAELKAA